MKKIYTNTMQQALTASALTLLISGTGIAAEESGVGPTQREAQLYCEYMVERLHILAEDKDSYMTQCTADYMERPPGDVGVDAERGSSGY